VSRSIDHTTPTGPDQLAELFTELGRDLSAQQSLDEVLTRLTHRSVAVVPGAELAGITRSHRGTFETVAPTDDRATRVDQIQYDLRSGPCVDAIMDNTVYRTGDLARELRWPDFGRRAVQEEGIHSVLSVRFFLEHDDMIAGLNIYAARADAFDESAQTVAMLLATHGALAVTAARLRDKTDNLERALKTSRTIGMAMGILMANHKVTDEQAFDLLRIASQHTHTKLADIATKVTETGALDLPKLARGQQRARSRPRPPG
jgi:transcriptional regulator with GAF, ATPase, and Fis domain